MLNGLTKRDPLSPLQPRRRVLMQPLQTLSASWMLCSVSGCLRRCLRGTSLADQCVLNGATTDQRMGAKNKTASASLCSFRAALFGADKAATLLRISPGVKWVTSVWPAITNWTVPPHGICRYHVMRYSGRLEGGLFPIMQQATGRPVSVATAVLAGFAYWWKKAASVVASLEAQAAGRMASELNYILNTSHPSPDRHGDPPSLPPPLFSNLDLLPLKLPHRTVQG